MLRWTRDHVNIMLQEVAESVQRMNAREADKRGEAVRVCKQTIGRACGKTCDSVVYASVGLFRGARLSWCAVLLFVGTVLLHKKLVPVWICLGKFVVNYLVLVVFFGFVYALFWVPFAFVSLMLDL